MSTTWQTVPLSGRVRVEASAGTGKTWTIAMLYLRLLLQEGRRPGEILVGTFSEAAAAELRERIRARLHEALRVLDGRLDEPLLGDWLATLPDPPARLALRLQLAVLELDAAPIGTLHGLCRRILAEHPLATHGAVTGLELVDQDQLHAELSDDVWRQLAQQTDPPDGPTRQLLADGRDQLHRALRELVDGEPRLRLPDAARVAECALLDDATHAAALRGIADQGELFKRSNSALRGELLTLADALEGEPYKKSAFKYLTAANQPGAVLDHFKPAHRDSMQADPAIRFAIQVGAALEHAPTTRRAVGLAHCRERYLELRERWLQRNGMLAFSDLILRVHAAVSDPDSGLADALHARWPAALIDEFQDTDAQQYGIADRIYRERDGTLRGALLMVGDPKQAIYGFRGGDIHTYQRAAAGATQRLDLDTNHRSSRALVDALNGFYAAAKDGFAIPGDPGDPTWFGYHPVKASSRRDGEPCCEGGEPVATPLLIHALPTADTPQNAQDRRDAALDACAERIAGILAGGAHTIGGRPIGAGDIAVLLPKNDQIRALRERLRRRGVPCAGAGRSDVFSTPWAMALQLLLWAWRHPADAGAVRAALMSPLFDLPYAQVATLQSRAHEWTGWLERFTEDARRWREAGVLAALTPLIEARATALLANPEAGERALTDLRHLGELLADAEAEGRHGDGLIAWLARQRREAEGGQSEERQLRVESDSARVQLMTLHASKGLEFPWVMLPLMWDQTGRDITFPRVPTDSGIEIDLGSAAWNAAQQQAREEDQRERLRLLYVALTRAIHRCDVWALDPQRPASGRGKAPAVDPVRSALDRLLATIHPEWGAAPPAIAGVGWQPAWQDGHSRLAPTQDSDGSAGLPPPPPLQHRLDSLVSFSSLIDTPRAEPQRAEDETHDAPDDEEAPTPAEPPHPELLAWEPLRGVGIGNALHALLERDDFARRFTDMLPVVSATLKEHGFEGADLAPRVARRLDAVLDTELAPGLRLRSLPGSAQRAELDFRLPLPGLSLAALRRACEQHGDPGLWPAHIPPRHLHGLFNGRIDLVFAHDDQLHVLDYKSNRLGLTLADYGAASLQRSMTHSAYRLQALLYTVAVHRYLRQRRRDYDPQRHLGSAWYLYLRAVGLAPQVGIWTHRFPPRLIEAVDAVLAGEDAT